MAEDDPGRDPDIIDFLEGQRRLTGSLVSDASEDDPDEAAHALKLGRELGMDPTLVHADVDNFEKQHRAELVSKVLENNEVLSGYFRTHPLAPSVSHDDVAQLDAITQSLGDMGQNSFKIAAKSFMEGLGDEEEFWRPQYTDPKDIVDQRDYPGWWKVREVLYGTFVNMPSKVTIAALHAIRDGGTEELVGLGMDRGEAKRLAKDITGWIEERIQSGRGFHDVGQAMKAGRKAAPYFLRGEDVPPYLDPWLDKYKADQARKDATSFDKVLTEVKKSKTTERDADSTIAFLKDHPEVSTIGIRSEAIEKLYGDEVPAPDDGKLGWIPNLAKQLADALEIKGDIDVSAANYLAKVEPEVHKALRDDLRLREQGFTLDEVVENAEREAKAKAKEEAAAAAAEPQLLTAVKDDTGQVHVGAPGQLHFDILEPSKVAESGYVTPEGKFLNKEEAYSWVKENERKGLEPSPVYGRALDAKEYREGPTVAEAAGILEAPTPEMIEARRLAQRSPFQQAVDGIREALGWDKAEPGPPEKPPFTITSDPAANAVRIRGKLNIKGIEVRPLGSTTLSQMLSEVNLGHLERRGLLTQHFKDLAKRLSDKVGDVAVHVVDQASFDAVANTMAYYDGWEHHIVFSENAFRRGHGFNAYVALHEALHAATFRAISVDPMFERAIRDLMDEVLAKRPDLAKKYGMSNVHEFITESFTNSDFHADVLNTRLSPTLAKHLGIPEWRNATAFDYIKDFIRRYLGLEKGEFSAMEAVLKITEQITDLYDPKAPHIVKRMAEWESKVMSELSPVAGVEAGPFKDPKSIGMRKKIMTRLMERVERRRAEDENAERDRGQRLEEKRQTAEWKQLEKETKAEVEDDLAARPDIALTNFFKKGEYLGETLSGELPKLDLKYFRKEQIAGVSQEIFGRGGMNPEYVAQAFRYPSVDAMMDHLRQFEATRGNKSFDVHVSDLIRDEVAKRMDFRYGDLKENILEAAKDHVLGSNDLDLLYDLTLRMAMTLSHELTTPKGLPFTKQNVEAFIKTRFRDDVVGKVANTDRYLREAAKQNRTMEAFLDDDPMAALKAQQEHFYNTALAREALKLQRERVRFKRTMKSYAEPTKEGVSQQYLNYIHQIMQQIGQHVERSPEHIAEGIRKLTGKTLEQFHQYENNVGLPGEASYYDVDYSPRLSIYPQLFDAGWKVLPENMTVGQFREVHNSIRSLIKLGREEGKILKDGKVQDAAKIRDEMIERIEYVLKEKPAYHAEHVGGFRKAHKFAMQGWTGLMQMRAFWERLDQAVPGGIFDRVFGTPLSKAGNEYSALQRQFSKEMAKIQEIEGKITERIPESPFIEPDTFDLPDPQTRPMSRENLRKVMLYLGHPSGIDILTRGHKVEYAAVKTWVDKYATKADWEYVQGVWNIYKKIKVLEDHASMARSGTTIESIPHSEVVTPHGTYPGGYFPVTPDRLYMREGPGGTKELFDNAKMWLRPMTSHGWEISRTGWAGPLDLTLANITSDISRRLKDLAMRDVIVNSSRIMLDPKFLSAVRRHAGEHYADLMEPYLQDMAGQVGITPSAVGALSKLNDAVRTNTIAMLLFWKTGTVIKHGLSALSHSAGEIGPINLLLSIVRTWGDPRLLAGSKNTNWHFAMHGMKIGNLDWKGSQAVQRRVQNYEETLGGSHDVIIGKPTIRQRVMQWGSKPVAASDMFSTIPLWDFRYREVFEKEKRSMPVEEAHVIAEAEADKALEFAHGTTAITSRPLYMRRGGSLGRNFTSLYAFYNHVLNRVYRFGWQTKDMMKGTSPRPVATDLADLGNRLLFYSVGPITAYYLAEKGLKQHKKDDSPWLEASIHTLGGMIPVFREIVQAVSEGKDPSVGILGADYHGIANVIKDIKKLKAPKMKDVGASIEHAVALVGIATGMGADQVGKWAKFGFNYYEGRERPKTAGDWYRAFRRGTIKEAGRR